MSITVAARYDKPSPIIKQGGNQDNVRIGKAGNGGDRQRSAHANAAITNKAAARLCIANEVMAAASNERTQIDSPLQHVN